MTIVLPHGVLFRGDAVGGADGLGEGEGRIRRNLIENNNIEAIIGLPANIFYGTGIPTIIMVLRQNVKLLMCFLSTRPRDSPKLVRPTN